MTTLILVLCLCGPVPETAGTSITLGCVPSTVTIAGRGNGKMSFSVLPERVQKGICLSTTDGVMTFKYRPPSLNWELGDGINDDLVVVYGPARDLYKAISEVEYKVDDEVFTYRFFVVNSPPKINIP